MAATTLHRRPSVISLESTQGNRREFNRQEKKVAKGHLGKVWSNLEVDLPAPLEERFVGVKKRLVTIENYEAVQDSWDRLRAELKKRAIEIEAAGSNVRTTPMFKTTPKAYCLVVHPHH